MEVHFTVTGASYSEIRAKIDATLKAFAPMGGQWQAGRVVAKAKGSGWKATVAYVYFPPEELF